MEQVIKYWEGGWTCVCGQYVAFGNTHSCTWAASPNYWWYDTPAQIRIAEALERIAKALEEKE